MQTFLHLKTWQLFLLLFGVPMGIQVGVMAALFTGQLAPWAGIGILFVWLLALGLLLSWFYTLGTHLHRRLPATAPMSLPRFRIAVLLPVVYVFLLLVCKGSALQGSTLGRPNGGLIALFLVLHLSSMACIFYCLYFTAKALKTAEKKSLVSTSEYLWEFFLLWFYPVGIWLLQPRVNHLFAAAPPETLD
jgi:hypothetical protein